MTSSVIVPQVAPESPPENGSVIQHPGGFVQRRRTAEEIVATRARVLEVMRLAMKEGVHYGTIPGTPKPSLYKPGAEMLLSMFRMGSKPLMIEDLSTYDAIRYRVHVAIYDVATDAILEVGVGECSSNESKYRWRQPICMEEFEEGPEDHRRSVWKRAKGGGVELQRQVRTEPADIANTILKMAKKRAKIDATLGATACSDVFGQDVEDLPKEWSEIIADDTGAVTGEIIGEEPHAEPKPAPAPAPDPDRPGIRVVSVRLAKQGKTDRGTWKFYVVKFSDGFEAGTLSETVANAAKALAESKAIVTRETEHDEQRNRENLILVEAVK